MPYRKRISELDLKIENLRTAIEALRSGSMSRTEIDRLLSELARVKAERLRLMLRQVNFGSERGSHEPTEPRKPRDRKPSAPRLDNPEG